MTGELPRLDISDCLVDPDQQNPNLYPLLHNVIVMNGVFFPSMIILQKMIPFSEHRPCAMRCPLTEVCPLAGHKPRAVFVRHSRRRSQRAGEQPMSLLPFFWKGEPAILPGRFTLFTCSAFVVGIQPISSVGE